MKINVVLIPLMRSGWGMRTRVLEGAVDFGDRHFIR
jgi:hypothetical protein